MMNEPCGKVLQTTVFSFISKVFPLLHSVMLFGIGMSADVLSCAVDVVHSKAMILANSVLSLYLIYNNVLLLADKLTGVFVVVLFYFFILSLLSAFWYFFALARFAFRVPRGAIFAGASRDQSLQSSPMRRSIFVCFVLFLYLEFVERMLVLLGIGSLCFSRPTRRHLCRRFA